MLKGEPMDKVFLKEWRVFAQLTQRQIADRLGYTEAQISRVENGKRVIKGRYLRAYKDVINKRLDEIKVPFPRLTHFGDVAMAPEHYFQILKRVSEWPST